MFRMLPALARKSTDRRFYHYHSAYLFSRWWIGKTTVLTFSFQCMHHGRWLIGKLRISKSQVHLFKAEKSSFSMCHSYHFSKELLSTSKYMLLSEVITEVIYQKPSGFLR